MKQKLLTLLQSELETEQKSIDKFKKNFDENYAHALSWGTEVFAAAAAIKVIKYTMAELAHPESTVESVQNMLLRKMTHKAKFPASSTSETSNLIEKYELASIATLFGVCNTLA